jgi:hypothetical protein
MKLASNRRAQSWQRRLAALLMLVLHVGLVVAPLADHPGGGRRAHVEQRGARHAQAHNEETCALCAAGSARATVTPRVETPVVVRDVRRVRTAYFGRIMARDPPIANTSRAPPHVG